MMRTNYTHGHTNSLMHMYVAHPHGARVLVGKGLLTTEAPRSHSDTLHSVRLLSASDRPNEGTSN